MFHLPPGQHTLRRGRVSIPGQYYHVTCATVNRVPVFIDWSAGRPVVNALRAAERANDARTLAYCLMPDHLHWLLELKRKPLDQVVGHMKGRASREHQARRATAGHLWQRGYYDHAIRTDESLLNVARYLVANPLRAGLVAKIGDYPLWDTIWL